MDVQQAIEGRRSIRRYGQGEVSREDIERILDAAMRAPSARNSRPWTFVVITDKDTRVRIAESTEYMNMIPEASAAILVCGLEDRSNFWQQDCGAAIQNMLLEAHSLGLGTCWCGVYPVESRVEVIRDIVGEVEGIPMALVALGIPDESPDSRGYYEPSKVRWI